MDKLEPFWLVWREGSGYTLYRHLSPDSAITEAKRLASENKGKRFFVLAPVGVAVVRDPVEWSFIEHPDQIPF